MKRILCVGAAVLDFVFYVDEFPTVAQKFGTESAAIVGGGCGANEAVTVNRLGGQAVLCAQFGQDQVGDLILADLATEGVEISCVTRTDGAMSSFSSIYIDPTGERQIMNFRGSGLVLDTDWFDDLSNLDAVLTDTRRVTAAVDSLNLAKKRKIPGIVDAEEPIDTRILAVASHVAFSMQGLNSLHAGLTAQDALNRVTQEYGCWACVTDGAHGVLFTGANDIEHIPAYSIQPRDTLGAGDVWHGAFALLLAEGQKEVDAIRFANAAAALKCMTLGGRKGTPNRAEVDEFMREIDIS